MKVKKKIICTHNKESIKTSVTNDKSFETKWKKRDIAPKQLS